MAPPSQVDPTLTRADRLVGQVLGQVGQLPDVYSELEINFFLLRRLLGVRTSVRSMCQWRCHPVVWSTTARRRLGYRTVLSRTGLLHYLAVLQLCRVYDSAATMLPMPRRREHISPRLAFCCAEW